MKKPTTGDREVSSGITGISPEDILAVNRLSAVETTSAEFGKVFRENPAAALATKGIMIDSAESKRVAESISKFAAGPASAAETEVGITVTVKF